MEDTGRRRKESSRANVQAQAGVPEIRQEPGKEIENRLKKERILPRKTGKAQENGRGGRMLKELFPKELFPKELFPKELFLKESFRKEE